MLGKLFKKARNFLAQKDERGFPVYYDQAGVRRNYAPMLKGERKAQWDNVQNPITYKQVKAWVKDLRSGKYKQVKSRLKKDGGFCCLGLLADSLGLLYETEDSYGHTIYNFSTENGSGGLLQIFDYTESKNAVPHYLLPPQLQNRYYTMNDCYGKSFKQIANQIEEDFDLG